MQSDGFDLAAAVGVEYEGRCGGVFIFGNHHRVLHGDVQIGEHVALRQGRQQQLFRVPAIPITVKSFVGRAQQHWQAKGRDAVVTAVVLVTRGTSPAVASPIERYLI